MKYTKRSMIATVVSVMLFASGPVGAEQGRGAGSGPKPRPVKATGGGGSHVSGPKSSPAPKVHGSGAVKSPKSPSTMAGNKGAKGPKATTAKGPKSTAPANAKSKTTTSTTTTTSSTGTGVALTPVQEKLQKNTNLASKLESRLPKGTDLMLASEGFRNLGQFVAAVNVSNNLNIPFAQLKTSMVDDGLSLGQSIKKLRPLADSTREASLAESQATVLLNTPPTTTTSTTKKPGKSGGSF
jgi:hypothetical protein